MQMSWVPHSNRLKEEKQQHARSAWCSTCFMCFTKIAERLIRKQTNISSE